MNLETLVLTASVPVVLLYENCDLAKALDFAGSCDRRREMWLRSVEIIIIIKTALLYLQTIPNCL